MRKIYISLILLMAISISFVLTLYTHTEIAFADDDEEYEYVIVDTDQTDCYDNDDVYCPAEGETFYGQDANYKGNKPDYEDNDDGTVTDLNTELMWQQDPGNKKTWDEAEEDLEDFDLAGYTDWRLPTIKELYSLILFSGVDPSSYQGEDTSSLVPFIDDDVFDFEYGDPDDGDRIIDAQYLSSTEYVDETMDGQDTAFGVNFADGRIKGYPIEEKEFFVMYVRGNPDYGINDFIDNDDGTITDNATGLMWAERDSRYGMNWEDALAYAQRKNEEEYLGYDDWRLPNAKELQSIVDYSKSPETDDSAAIDSVFDISELENDDDDYPYFWTSTTHISENGGSNAVYIAFGRALGYMSFQLMDVHGAGAQRSDPKTGDLDDYPYGHGPQGDVIRIYNYVRLVRGGEADEVTTECQSQDPELIMNILIFGGASAVIGTIIYIKRKKISRENQPIV